MVSLYITNLNSLEAVYFHIHSTCFINSQSFVPRASRHPVGRDRAWFGNRAFWVDPARVRHPTTAPPWGRQNITRLRLVGEKKQRLPVRPQMTTTITQKLNDMLSPSPSSEKWCVLLCVKHDTCNNHILSSHTHFYSILLPKFPQLLD